MIAKELLVSRISVTNYRVLCECLILVRCKLSKLTSCLSSEVKRVNKNFDNSDSKIDMCTLPAVADTYFFDESTIVSRGNFSLPSGKTLLCVPT